MTVPTPIRTGTSADERATTNSQQTTSALRSGREPENGREEPTSPAAVGARATTITTR